MIQLHRQLFGALAAVVMVGTFGLTQPAVAADMAPAAQAKADPVEAQIVHLRKQLQITDAQSQQFDAVAQVMRDNRSSHEAMVTDLRRNEKTMTAVEDLQNYGKIAQDHADGVKKLAVAFETLYGSMSDDQKKMADHVFRQHKRRAMQHASAKAQ